MALPKAESHTPIQYKEGIIKRIRYAVADGSPETILKVKKEARERGRLQGLFAEVVLFNAER